MLRKYYRAALSKALSLKRRQITAIILSMILVALFAASFLFSAEYKICSPNEYTHTKECTPYHYGPYVFAWLVSVADNHNGLITAIATVFVAIFTWTLWSVTGRAVSLAREEFISTHRPKIVLREVDFVDGRIIYILVNIGGTEATVKESLIRDEGHLLPVGQ